LIPQTIAPIFLCTYIKNLERICERAQWVEEQFVFLARQKFVGAAARAFETANTENWQEIRKTLIQQFGVPALTSEERFSQLKKKQTVFEYANEFRYLRTLCYPPDADSAKITNYEEVTEKRAVQQFIDGLGGTLAERVYSRAPESVADAIKFAVHEELSPAYKHSKVAGKVRAIDSDTLLL